MYGIVNKAIEELVKENYGEEKWELIKIRSAVDVDFFISNEPYDDAITYQLAGAVADEMKVPLSDVLIKFGEHCNLPVFHNRIMLMYPKLTPPEFKISDVEERSVCVHYYSRREGLQEFVRGLLQGLGKMYNTAVTIELLQHRNFGADHEIFKVSW